MNTDTATTWTTGAAFLQGTSRTDLCREMHGPTWLKGHFLLVRTADALPLPIELKGRLDKAGAVADWPGFAVNHQIIRPFMHQRATEIGSINVQFGQLRLLCGEIRLDRLGDTGFWHIGGGDTDCTHQPAVQIVQDVAFVAIHAHTAALPPMAHLGIFDADAAL